MRAPTYISIILCGKIIFDVLSSVIIKINCRHKPLQRMLRHRSINKTVPSAHPTAIRPSVGVRASFRG